MSRPWTSREVRYLEEHAHEGAAEVARALGRTPPAVKFQAHQYGISLRTRWHCPRCGTWVHKPLSDRTGWCRACTLAKRNDELAEEAAQMEEEVRREKEQERRRQAIYARKHRAKKRRK